MATLLKIHGLDRASSQSLSSGEQQPRGFRVPSSFVVAPSGVAALNRIGVVGTPNAVVRYTAKQPGSWANAATGGGSGLNIKHATLAGSSVAIAVTYPNAGSGVPLITVTPGTASTAADVVNAFNAHPEASQFATASLGGTGGSTAVASANASAVYTITQATGTSTSGTFKITIPGFGTTAGIATGATGATVATAVQTLIQTNPSNSAATVTGSATTLPASTTLTMGGTGGASLPFPDATIDNTSNVGGTYGIALTTWGQSANGALNGGLSSGTTQTLQLEVSSRRSAVVDVDNTQTAKMLRRNRARFIELGAV